MKNKRVIPVLLLKDGDLVKGVRFQNHKYIGDPINAVRIFNEKEVDELILLDISATANNRDPDYSLIQDVASEAFMPIAYGGGINSVSQIEKLFRLGIEKIIINSSFSKTPDLLKQCSRLAGAQSVVVSIDVRKNFLGRYEVVTHNGTTKTGYDPISYAKQAEELGAGELFVTAVDREGTGKGYDIELFRQISLAVNIPVVAHGGAASLLDLRNVAQASSVTGVAAGTLFTFHGKHKAVLLTYPSYVDLEKLFND